MPYKDPDVNRAYQRVWSQERRGRTKRVGRQKRALPSNTKLDAEQVRMIRAAVKAGESMIRVGAEFAVNRTTVWKIVTRKSWKNVK